MTPSRSPWWRGARGEWYVVAQIVLLLLVIFGPKGISGLPAWPPPHSPAVTAAGGFVLAVGFLLVVAGIWKQGEHIAAVPYPKEDAVLIESGPYRIVRHPMYSGAILMAFGWAFFTHGALTVLYAGLLFVFFDRKARREEFWLRGKFSGYAAYQKRVNKLIPLIY